MEKSSSNDPRDLALGCGSNNTENNCTLPPITLNISTTTGGSFSVDVDSSNTVENLKKIIAKKLRVAKDRICLLHRERELHEGTLKDNGLIDESKIILIPNVETGLLAQRPENTVMQALESLNDNQVNDFLSGKTPLNLSMRLGDHMMLIQLQLSTVTPTASSTPSTSRSSKSSTKSKLSPQLTTPQPSTSGTRCPSETTKPTSCDNIASRSRSTSIDFDHNSFFNAPTTPTPDTPETSFSAPDTQTTQTPAASSAAGSPSRQRDLILNSKEFENLKSLVNSLSTIQQSVSGGDGGGGDSAAADSSLNYESDSQLLEQSPIKSLSNLVSSPIKTTSIKSIPIAKYAPQSKTRSAIGPVPMQTDSSADDDESEEAIANNAKFTSCICKRLNTTGLTCDTSVCQHQDGSSSSSYSSFASSATTSTASTSSASLSSAMKSLQSALLHRTTNNPITKKRHHYTSAASTSAAAANSMFLRRSKSSDSIPASSSVAVSPTLSVSGSAAKSPDIGSTSNSSSDISSSDMVVSTPPTTPPGTLAEASRSLTQTLRKLSKEVFTNKVDAIEDSQRKTSIGSGAVIESMKNHGKGIYSGTFSGTLNPALQDRNGRPKRDISTVIHILNDLLSATPHYTRGARICFEPTRSIKQASSSRALSSKAAGGTVCSKCNRSPSKVHESCSYTECNSPSSEPTYCDKHKPMDELPTAVSSPPSPDATAACSSLVAPSHFCHCSRKLNFDETSTGSTATPSSPATSETNAPHSVCVCAGVSSTDIVAAEVTPAMVCIKCSSIAMENSKTKSKLEQLRLVMQQKKERREARKLQGLPYGSRLTTATATAAVATHAAGTTAASMIAAAANDVTAAATLENLVEEVDTAA